MRSRMIAYVAGSAAVLLLPSLPSLYALSALLLLPLLWRRWPVVAFALIGAAWALLWCDWQLSHRLHSPDKSDWQVSGTIDDMVQRQGDVQRFNLVLEQLTPLAGQHPEGRSQTPPLRRIRLAWYRSDTPLLPGDRLTLEVRLQQPRGMANPEAFDYERWLLRQGIDATGYVRRFLVHAPGEAVAMARWRQQLMGWQAARYAGEAAGLVHALTLGVRQQLTPAQEQLLQLTGTVHLAVISGLHIGFIAAAVFALLRLVPRYLGWDTGRVVPVLVALLLAAAYVFLAGAGTPTIRAFLMVAVFLLAEMRFWRISAWNRWWLALAVVLTYSPLALFETGFWLSFLAVAVLLWGGTVSARGLLGWRTQWMIFLAMAPLLAYCFAGVSLLAPLVNLVAIPWVGLMLVAMALDHLLALLGTSWSAAFVDMLVAGFWWLLALFSQLSQTPLSVARVDASALLLGLLGSFLLLQPRGFPGRYLGILLWLPWLFGRGATEAGDGFSAWVFDVGQGTAVLVEVGEQRLLYDTGPAYRSGGTAFERAVEPYLRAEGIGQLQLLVLSHADLDHSGGADRLLQQFSVGRVLSGNPQPALPLAVERCRPGQAWSWGKVQLRMLAGGAGADDNAASCVMLIDNGHCSLLLSGDIDAAGERRLAPPVRPLTWLLAAHHGSASSTSIELLQRWRPQAVIFSAGFANPFGHPASAVVERLEQRRLPWFNTARDGAIRLDATADGTCIAQGWRQQAGRFWSVTDAP